MQLAKLTTGNAVFSSCSVARLVNEDLQQRQQQHHVHHSSFLLFCGSHDNHVYCWEWQGESFLTKWKTNIDSEVYSIPFVSNIAKAKNVVLHHDLPSEHSTLSKHPNITRSSSTRELGHALDSVTMRNRERERIPVSIPEQVQMVPLPESLNEPKNNGSGFPTQAMYAPQVQICSCVTEESSAAISSQELVTVLCVCSSNGVVFLLSGLSGEVLGRYKAPWDVYASPVVVENDIVFGCRNDNVYKLSIIYES